MLAVFFNGILQNLLSVKQVQLWEQQDIPIIQPYRQSLFKADEKCMPSAKVRHSQLTTGLNDL